MLRAVLSHPLRKLIVHVILDTIRGVILVRGFFTDNDRLDWASRREGLHDGFGLKTYHRFGQDRVIYPAGAFPRLSLILVAQTQQVQTFHIHLGPFLPGLDVGIKITHKINGQRAQDVVFQIFSEVGVELVARFFFGHQVNFYPVYPHAHVFRILDNDFHIRAFHA
ncbi:hypothetical protein D3C87_1137070 [compost metagenome]